MFAVPKPLARLVPLAFAAILGGCWISAEPLVTDRNAATVPFEGTYASSDGDDETVSILAAPSGKGYNFNQGDESVEVHFIAIGNGWYVLQMIDPVKEPQDIDLGPDLTGKRVPTGLANYQLLGLSGDVIRIFKTECTEDVAALSGVEKDRNACVIEDLASLRAAARVLATSIVEGRTDPEVQELRPLGP
ncbi:hypothetical protein ACI5KX_04360 [Erythrobacter sp. GH1-10]|uniref:hypothetical protein n=1 Tax=Erythrobacter sp. GH1-10 TaxID=3349334 RepID=UPI0038778FCA